MSEHLVELDNELKDMRIKETFRGQLVEYWCHDLTYIAFGSGK